MLRSAKELVGYSLKATNGEIGKIDDFYFDDHTWTIRYIIADTGTWLAERKVLISPYSAGTPDTDKKQLPVNLTMQQVEDSPGIDADKPVSRQNEIELIGYYGWPTYWTSAGADILPGTLPFIPIGVSNEQVAAAKKAEGAEEEKGDPNLRSVDDVTGYNIKATDGGIGHVEDFIIDDEKWIIRYMIVDTRNLLPGKKVLVALPWIKKIEWATSEVEVNLLKDKIKNSPEWDPSKPLAREYEDQLHKHYDQQIFW